MQVADHDNFERETFRSGGAGKAMNGSANPHRLLMSSLEIIDTRKVAGLKKPLACKKSKRDKDFRQGWIHREQVGDVSKAFKQFYIQTKPFLTAQEKMEIEEDIGAALGSYFPNNAYIFFGNEAQAQSATCSRHVVWVGERPSRHKMDEGLLDRNVSDIDSGWISIYATLVAERFRPAQSCKDLADELVRNLEHNMGIEIKMRMASSSKIALDLEAYYVRDVAETMAQQWWVEWVERKAVFSTRMYAGNRLVLAGDQADAKVIDVLPTVKLGLDGTGQVRRIVSFFVCMTFSTSLVYHCFMPKLSR